MADKLIKWVDSTEPKPQIYTNFVHTSWTLFDIRLQLGQLIPAEAGVPEEGFVVESRGAVTVAWPAAKGLRDTLVALIESYEKTNGEIKPLKLVPTPEILAPPKQAPEESK